MTGGLSRREDGEGAVPVGEILDALGDERRRHLLWLLASADRDCPVGIESLAVEIAMAVDPADPDQLAVDLHHNQLPRLDEIGLLTYDPAARVVTATDAIDEIEPFLDYLETKRTR